MPRKKAEKFVHLTPEEVLCAIGEFVRRHKDARGGSRFTYDVRLQRGGGATVALGSRPTRKQAAEWEEQLRVRREALH
jgi:hypothetical protein